MIFKGVNCKVSCKGTKLLGAIEQQLLGGKTCFFFLSTLE
jgi:hypothetical protein